MDKAPDAYRTISEVGEDLDIAQHVLRFWETRFPQIKPLKRGGGRRYYRPDDVELLKGIRHLLYREGYTIKGVQRILREQGLKDVMAVGRSGSLAALAPAPEPDWTPAPAPVAAPSVSPPVPAFNTPAFLEPPVIAPQPVHMPVQTAPPVTMATRAVPAPSTVAPTKKPVAAESAMPLLEAMLPSVAVESAQNPAQVSMFRGGLQRGPEIPSPVIAEPAAPEESSAERKSRLRLALSELEACRAILAAHQRRAG